MCPAPSNDDFGERRIPPPATEMIVRIDERTNQMLNEMKMVREVMVTRAEFSPVKSLVYGLVGLIMASVIVAILSVVISNSK